jgi:uncharacterized protein YndB with AHSA1/START domain
MKNNLSASVSVDINASTSRVWRTITSPSQIKLYLMGTHVTTNWQEGSPISYTGEYNGKQYEDKGVIKKLEPGKCLQSTYWSSMGGKEDIPENYNIVTYTLDDRYDHTILTLTQDTIGDEKEKAHAIQNWTMVLDKLKQVAEKINDV